MTAVTVDQAFDNVPKAIYHALLDIDEAYTWVCPMGNPEFAHITKREDSDAIVNYTLSGRTFTFHESVGSGVKIAITVYGKL
jgi:hypothetical protein